MSNNIPVSLLLGALDASSLPFNLFWTISGYLLIYKDKNKQSVLINKHEHTMNLDELRTRSESGHAHYEHLYEIISNGRIHLTRLCALVFNNSLDVGLRHFRLSTNHSIERRIDMDNGVCDYVITHPTNHLGNTIYHVPPRYVDIGSVNYNKLTDLLSTFTEELNSYTKFIYESEDRFNISKHDVSVMDRTMIYVDKMITKKFPSVCHMLKIEEDVHSLRVMNVGFEMPAYWNSQAVTMFGTYELDSVDTLNSVIDKTIKPLLIWINLANYVYDTTTIIKEAP